MLDDRKILKAIRKQIAKGALQYFLVAVCAGGAAATVAHSATHVINSKFESVLVALKRH